MTVQEAKKQILWLKNDLDELRYNPSASKRMKEACDIARESMEKQIPKKPKVKPLGQDIEVECPTCGNVHIFLDTKKGDKYCNHCGQKLDWEEGADDADS